MTHPPSWDARLERTVCLVIPPSVFLLDERVFVSLGILRVAAVLERAGYYVEMLDLSGIENYLQAVDDHAGLSRAAVFGLTATTPQLPAARAIIERLPARHLVDMDSYRYEIEGRRAVSLIAQLGCPFGCGFCGGRNTATLRQIRRRSVRSIAAEVEQLYRTYGYTAFMFYDDELNVSPSMVELMDGLSHLQERLGVDFRLRGFIKSELFTDQQADAMYRAGFRWLLVGFEAAHERILANINKRATRDDNTRCMEVATRHGLKVKALMSIGHPGETHDSAAVVQRWLCEVRPADFDCTIITTYPGTPYYDEAVPHEEIASVYTYTTPRTADRLHAYDVDFSQVAEYYKGNPDGGYNAYVFTDYLSSGEIVAARDWIERSVRATLRIAFNPSRVAARYEHSMGMPGPLPPHVLRVSSPRLGRDAVGAVAVDAQPS